MLNICSIFNEFWIFIFENIFLMYNFSTPFNFLPYRSTLTFLSCKRDQVTSCLKGNLNLYLFIRIFSIDVKFIGILVKLLDNSMDCLILFHCIICKKKYLHISNILIWYDMICPSTVYTYVFVMILLFF